MAVSVGPLRVNGVAGRVCPVGRSAGVVGEVDAMGRAGGLVRVKRRIVPFAVDTKASGGDGASMRFEGYAACTKNLDHHGEIIAPGAFAADLPWFLANGFVGGLNHDWSNPVGTPTAAAEDGKGLFVGADVRPTTAGKDLMLLMRPGADGGRPVVAKLSIGFEVLGREYLETAEEVQAYWQSVGYTPSPDDMAGCQYGAKLLTRVRLLEFSPVTLPANELCDITGVKGGQARARLSFEDELVSARAAVDGCCDRAEQLCALRAKQGRSLLPERRWHLLAMKDRIDTALGVLTSEVSTSEGVSDVDADRVRRSRRLLIEADSLLEDLDAA